MKHAAVCVFVAATLVTPASASAQNWTPQHQLTSRAEDSGALTFLATLRPVDVARRAAGGVAHHARYVVVPDQDAWDAIMSQGVAAAAAVVGEGGRRVAPLAGDGPAIRSLRGTLAPPVDIAELVAGFGPRRRTTSHTDNRHTGWSFGVPIGAPVQAIARGVVTWSGPIDGLGLTIIVDHGDGVHTIYAQLVERMVVRGDTLDAGDVVGHGGAMTSFGTREVYFEVRVEGVPEDPGPWMTSEISEAAARGNP